MLFSCTSLHATAVAPLADRGSPASRSHLYICCCDNSIGTRLLHAGRLYIICCRCVDSIVAPSSGWGDCKCYLVKIRPSRLGGRGRAGAEGTVGNPICLTLLLQSSIHSFIHSSVHPSPLPASLPSHQSSTDVGRRAAQRRYARRAARGTPSTKRAMVVGPSSSRRPVLPGCSLHTASRITWPCSLHLSISPYPILSSLALSW
jgi:hypothetical protein